MSTLIPKFGYCTTLGGTPVQNPGIAPAAGIRIGAKNGPSLGAYMVTYNGGSITGQYDYYGMFDDQILNLSPGSHTLELRENLSLPVTDSWVLTVTDVNNLPAAIPRERQNDPTDDPRFIDLALLGKNPLLVIILTADNRFESDDTINVTVTVKMPNLPDVVVPLSGTVATDQFGQKQPLVLQAANNLFSTGATVLIDYKLLRGTTPVGDSDTATAQVIGVALPDLFAPRFQKSIAGKLDPLDPANLQGANAQAEVLDALPTDTAKMIVQGAPGVGSPTFTAIPFNTNKRANFALTSTFLAANIGKRVKFHYQFLRGGNSYDSVELDASVDRIADFEPRLPVATIDGNVTPDLDVTKLLPTSEFRLEPWPHQGPGQIGWLTYKGVDINGNSVVYDDLKGVPLDAGLGLVRSAPVDLLEELKDGSILEIFFGLNYDGVANESGTVKCPVRRYTVQALEFVAPKISSLTDSNQVEIPPGGATVDTIVILNGTAPKLKDVEIFDGVVSKGTATANGGIWTKRITGLVAGTHSFTAKGLYGNPNPVSDARTLRQVEPIALDPTPVTLNGAKLLQNLGWSAKEVAGNTFTRVPTRGTPPYTYVSSQPAFASVSKSGLVTGLKNGSALITVTDANNLSASYPVDVSNIFRVIAAPSMLGRQAAINWGNSVGAIRIASANSLAHMLSSNFSNLPQFLPADPGSAYWPPTNDNWITLVAHRAGAPFITSGVLDYGAKIAYALVAV